MITSSALYVGSVRHRRHAPVPHAFDYTLGLFYLDLDELDDVARAIPFFSVDRPNVISFYRRDYLGDARTDLASAVRTRIREAYGDAPSGPVRMLTHPRYLGYCFNPVTFYYCFREDGETLDTIVAEITNTPWNERHAYVLRVADAGREGAQLRFDFDKRFHVSPFLPMALDYVWRFASPGERLSVTMDVQREGTRVFDVSLQTRREAISARAALGLLRGLLPMTLKVMLGIHYEALRVHLKRNPFHAHPKHGKVST